VLPSPLLQHLEVPDMMLELSRLSRSDSGVEDLPFTKYLVKMATILRDHLQTNASDEAIQKDMVDVVLFMQGLSQVGEVLYKADPVCCIKVKHVLRCHKILLERLILLS
jgi:hypothetical protein